MEQASAVDWRCTSCWRTNKANTSKCARCGVKWSYGNDPNYVPQKQAQSPRRATWNYSGWTSQSNWKDWNQSGWKEGQQRAKTPKKNQGGDTPRKKASTKKKGNGNQFGPPDVEPPWTSNYVGGPAGGAASEDLQAMQEKLTIMATALQDANASMSSNVQNIVNEYTAPVPTTKSLKTAVDKMDKARKKLREAEKARLNLHSSWRQYIADSLERWTQFAEKFSKDDQELADRVKAAKEKLQTTKEEVDAKKTALEEQDEDEQINISDDDMAEKVDGSEQIQVSLNNMVTNLQTLQQQAAAAIVEAGENKAKRPRLNEDGGTSGEQPAALQPFHKPGK